MKKNMAIWDRLLRTLAAVIILILFSTGSISGMTATVLLGVSFLYLVTSAIGYCPMYPILGIRTLKK